MSEALPPGHINLSEISESARAAWTALRDELRSILHDDLVAIWAHGGSTSVRDPAHAGDLDTYVLVSHQPDSATARQLDDAEARLAGEHAIEWDNWYVLAEDARRSDPPRHAWRHDRRDVAWSLHRSHWLSGRYVLLHGPEPEAIVMPPTWDEVETDLSRELEHVERHLAEGDTDAYEATYAILNGSRIVHALESQDVAISKRAAGIWALEHLPDSWRPVVEAALRSYDGSASADDIQLLAAEMKPFVAFVRERLPYADDRPADALPRWSGY